MSVILSTIHNMALPEFFRHAFDPYAEAQPVLVCPECVVCFREVIRRV